MSAADYTNHQFGMFGHQRPRLKLPIDPAWSAKLKEARRLFQAGKRDESAALLREVREGLQSLQRRIVSGKRKKKPSGRLAPGDPVVIEIEGHGKSEYVDATVISTTGRSVKVKTYWGQIIEGHPARLVRRALN